MIEENQKTAVLNSTKCLNQVLPVCCLIPSSRKAVFCTYIFVPFYLAFWQYVCWHLALITWLTPAITLFDQRSLQNASRSEISGFGAISFVQDISTHSKGIELVVSVMNIGVIDSAIGNGRHAEETHVASEATVSFWLFSNFKFCCQRCVRNYHRKWFFLHN